MNNTEQELKLALTESEYAALLSVCGAAPQLQTNYYFVYDNMSADEVLRVRAKNAAYLLCYKRKIAVDSDVYVSDERETAIDRATAMEMLRGGMQAPLVKQLVGANIPQTAHCIGKTDTYRAAFDLLEWRLELDKNVYCGVVDYELECESADRNSLACLTEYLHDRFSIPVRHSAPKFSRFLAARPDKLAKRYKYLIFDFDGTLNDTSAGIYSTFTKVLAHFGVDASKVDLSRHIGPPLTDSYTKLVGANNCQSAIQLHKRIFDQDNAAANSRLYDGVTDMLDALYNSGKYVLAVASSKYQPHVEYSLKYRNLDKYFAVAYGQTETRGFKSEVLAELLSDMHWNAEQCLMIGDTLHDIDGANINGIDAVAVTYGFGDAEQLYSAKTVAVCDSPAQIAYLLE